MVQRVSKGVSPTVKKKLAEVSEVAKKVQRGEMVEARQPRTTEKMDITGTVAIACSAPSGIILRKFVQIDNPNPVGPMGREPPKMWIADPEAKPVRVRGPNTGRGADSKSIRFAVAGGYAITRNVPRDVWESWLEHNQKSPLVRNRMIFACPSANEAEAEAEKAGHKSGYEPMDPEAAPKEMRGHDRKHLRMQMADED